MKSCSPILGHKKTKTLNKSSVAAARHAGIGRRGLQTFTASTDMLPPITARAYSSHNKQIAEDVGRVGKKNHARSCGPFA